MPNLSKIIDNGKIVDKLNPVPSYVDLLHSSQNELITEYKLTKAEGKELFTKLKDYNELSKQDLTNDVMYKVFLALGIPSNLSTYLVIDKITVEEITEDLLKCYTEYDTGILNKVKANLEIYHSDTKYFISRATYVKPLNSRSYDDTRDEDNGQKSLRIKRISQQ